MGIIGIILGGEVPYYAGQGGPVLLEVATVKVFDGP